MLNKIANDRFSDQSKQAFNDMKKILKYNTEFKREGEVMSMAYKGD